MLDAPSRVGPPRETPAKERAQGFGNLTGLVLTAVVVVGVILRKSTVAHPVPVVLMQNAVLIALFLGIVLGAARWSVPRRAESSRSGLESGVQKSGGRLLFLDALRGFAALLVVAQHATEIAFPGFLENLRGVPTPGRFGVSVFFIISGFVIVRSLERDSDPRTFWTHRFLRIAPLYYAGLLVALVFLMSGILKGTGVTPGAPNFGRLLVTNSLMIAGYIHDPTVLGVYWTLGYEWAFYLLAFTAILALRRRIGEPLLLGVVGLLVAGTLIAPEWSFAFPNHFLFFGMFAIGVLFHELDRGELSRGRAVALVLIFLAAEEFATLRTLDLASIANDLARWSPAPVALFALAWSLRRVSVPSVLRWSGKISFSVYVVHAIVIQSLPVRMGAGLPYIVAVYAITLPIAALTQRWIEEPGIALARRWTPTRPGARNPIQS